MFLKQWLSVHMSQIRMVPYCGEQTIHTDFIQILAWGRCIFSILVQLSFNLYSILICQENIGQMLLNAYYLIASGSYLS